MNRLILIVSLFCVSACSTTSQIPDGKIVPAKTILAQVASRPYECYNYDARTDRCEALSKRSINANTLTMDSTIRDFVSGVGPITLNMVADFDVGETSFCSDLSKSEMTVSGGVIPSNFREVAIRSVKRDLARKGIACIAYLQDANGQYYNVTIDNSSGEIKGNADRVNFFAKPKDISL